MPEQSLPEPTEPNLASQLPEISRHGYWGPLPGESPELYESLGVLAMQRAILKIPDFWRGEFNMEAGLPRGARPAETPTPVPEPTRQERLERLITFTKGNETKHVATFAFIGAVGLLSISGRNSGGIGILAGVEALNVLGNIPTILVQRYNRLRAYRLLDKIAKSEAAATPE